MSTDTVPSLSSPSRLTDDELTAALANLAREARRSTAELVAHLAEFDARRLHLAAGYSSLFKYCHEVLRLSEHATYHRIEAARAAARFPKILDKIADGSLNLSTVRLLAPHLTEANHRGLLDQASLCSKREVEELVARLHPRPDVATIIRKLPARPVAKGSLFLGATSAPAVQNAPACVTTAPQMAAPPPVTLVALRSQQPVVVLAPGRYEIRFTVSAATREKLRTAQGLLRHTIPDGDTAEVFDRALTRLIEALLKRKRGGDRSPHEQRSVAPGSRHVPAAVRRAVWLRDGARCAFVATSGKRCPARAGLEFHHRKPYAVGGPSTVDNIALRCRAHNLYEGELIFGTLGPRSERGT